MNNEIRIEKDSMGEVAVPAAALYGAQTQRAVDNFRISPYRFHRLFLQALAQIKQASALANHELGLLPEERVAAIAEAAAAVADGHHDGRIPAGHLSDGFRDQHQHECQRSHRCVGRTGIGDFGPPQR